MKSQLFLRHPNELQLTNTYREWLLKVRFWLNIEFALLLAVEIAFFYEYFFVFDVVLEGF